MGVPDSEFRSQTSPVTLVEVQQALRCTIFRDLFIDAEELLSHGCCPQALALHGQERQLINGIDNPELAIEFETIEDYRLRLQAYVARSQVAVTFDNVAFRYPVVKQHGFAS